MRVLTPRCRQRTVGIGHSRKATSTEFEPVSITIRSAALRVTLVERALPTPCHSSVTVPNLGIARTGKRGLSPTRRWVRALAPPFPKQGMLREILLAVAEKEAEKR